MSAGSLVRSLLSSQVQLVLATVKRDHTPHTALMAYASSSDLRSVYLATPLGARKAQNMLERPTVSLLWDNRTGNLADHKDGLLVTAGGRARILQDADRGRVQAQFVVKNPNMAAFLEEDNVGLFEVTLGGGYELVKGYDRPEQWNPNDEEKE